MENYVDKAINELENYKTLRAAAHNIESEINRLKKKLKKTGAGSGSLVSNYTGEHGSTTFYNFEDVANEILAKDYELNNTLEKIQDIETALERLGTEVCMPDYQRVLILWHVEELSKEEICRAMNYESRQSIYNLYNRAIKKFAIILFGSAVLDNYNNEGIEKKLDKH
ncbi:MAG: hypothetical protein AB9883_07570 [Acidaminococcaceae bacterium]